MSGHPPVKFPAGYASGAAIGYTAESGEIVLVGNAQPLPVSLGASAPPESLSGATSGSTLVGPYKPVAGQPVVVQLSGEWNGTVALLRSVDGGATQVPVTMGGLEWGVFTANACEPVWSEYEDGAELYLEIGLTQGTLSYRVSQ
jgi:hypothetical protein